MQPDDLSPQQLNDAAKLMQDGFSADDSLRLAFMYGDRETPSGCLWLIAGFVAVTLILAIGLVALFH